MRRRALVGFAVGLGLGAVVPLPAAEVAETPAVAVAEADPEPVRLPSQAPPDPEVADFADPCLAVRGVQRRVDELAAEVDGARSAFSLRYGQPIDPPPDFDPVAAEQTWRETLEALPGHVWSTVDCTLYPCVARMLSERSWNSDEVQAELGLPRAEVTIADFDRPDLQLVGVSLIDLPQVIGPRRWVHTVGRASWDRVGPEVQAVLEQLAAD